LGERQCAQDLHLLVGGMGGRQPDQLLGRGSQSDGMALAQAAVCIEAARIIACSSVELKPEPIWTAASKSKKIHQSLAGVLSKFRT